MNSSIFKFKIITIRYSIIRFQNLVDNWSSFDLKNAPENDYIKDMVSISNAYYPDFSIYETLINNGDINLVDFEASSLEDRTDQWMTSTLFRKRKERERFIENHLMQNYSDL